MERGWPVVAVAALEETARWSFWNQSACVVPSTYLRALAAARCRPVIVPPIMGPELPTAVNFLDGVDGLLLLGGSDIDPAFYGADADEALETIYPERDEFEIALVRAAIDSGIPVLGICRGMQVLNVAAGGTLVQDIGDAGPGVHRRRAGTFEGNEHSVRIVPGSILAALGNELTVHSHHHQVIDSLADGYKVTAWAEDGTIEAIERSDGAWVLGVQWHAEESDSPAVFAAFAAAAFGWHDVRTTSSREVAAT